MMMFDVPASRDLPADPVNARLLRITDAQLLAAMRDAANESALVLDDPLAEDDEAHAISWVA